DGLSVGDLGSAAPPGGARPADRDRGRGRPGASRGRALRRRLRAPERVMRDGGAPDGAPAEPAQRLAARVVDTLVVGLPVTLVTTSEPLGLPPATAETLTAPILAGLLLVYETVQLAL